VGGGLMMGLPGCWAKENGDINPKVTLRLSAIPRNFLFILIPYERAKTGSKVKPIQRPQIIMAVQRVIDTSPAILAAGGSCI